MEGGGGGGGRSEVKPPPESNGGGHLDHRQNHQHHRYNLRLVRHASGIVLFLGLIVVTCFALYRSAYPFQFLPRRSSPPSTPFSSSSSSRTTSLKGLLKKAAMGDKTVIVTTLNGAWAAPNSVFEVFLESFRIGNQTSGLLKHLVVVALDHNAYDRCLGLHPHCYLLTTQQGLDFSGEAYFMTPNYLDMMWTRIDFLRSVLTMGYNFIFTDADIMWFRDPIPRFYSDADFQIACDYFRGRPSDLGNQPNGGFNYVKSSKRTIAFYKYWYKSRINYPGLHDQDVLNRIKFDPFIRKIKLKVKFLDTAYFGGFCQPSKDLNRVCTMHANCCFGLENKVHDLKVLLDDWRIFLSLPNDQRASKPTSWTVPQKCSTKNFHPPDLPKKNVDQESND